MASLFAAASGELQFGSAQGKLNPEPSPKRDYAQKYYHSFKGDPVKPAVWHFVGQGAPQFVKFEPEGLRITLPAGTSPGQNRSLGLIAGFGVRGDCEITTSFEILAEPKPEDAGSQTRITLRAELEKPGKNLVMLSRRVTPQEGTRFFSWRSLVNEASGQEEKKNNSVPTRAMTGQLRLVRTGSVVANYVAEGSEGSFKLLVEHPFGAGDLKGIEIVAGTGGPQAGLDVRVTDILIRADSLLGLDAAHEAPKYSVVNAARGGLAVALLVGLLITFTLALGVWFFLHRRKAAARLPADLEEN